MGVSRHIVLAIAVPSLSDGILLSFAGSALANSVFIGTGIGAMRGSVTCGDLVLMSASWTASVRGFSTGETVSDEVVASFNAMAAERLTGFFLTGSAISEVVTVRGFSAGESFGEAAVDSTDSASVARWPVFGLPVEGST